MACFDPISIKLKLGKYEGHILKSARGEYYFGYTNGMGINEFFRDNHINCTRFELQKECLGYYDTRFSKGDNTSTFPECKSEADVIKFINFLNERYPEHKSESVRKIGFYNAQKIINYACQNWKSELAENWGQNIVLGKDIEISEEYYQKMRKACTSEQYKLFDEIFGIECPFKKNDKLVVWNECKGNWDIRYFYDMNAAQKGKKYRCVDSSHSFITEWENAIPYESVNLPD